MAMFFTGRPGDEDRIGVAVSYETVPPLSARDLQMEQNRASDVLPHYAELARSPLDRPPAVVELIAATTTDTGLKVECDVDPRLYEKGVKVADAEFEAVHSVGDEFHPEWNYTIHPRPKPSA
jgi:hypothetical protein